MMAEELIDAGGPGPSGAHNPAESGPTPEPATNLHRKVANRGTCGGTSPLPPGMSWLPHDGYGARFRRHKQCWAQFEKLAARNGYAKATRERLLDWVSAMPVSEPQAEVIAMGIVLRAWCSSETTKQSWATSLNRALNELEEAEDHRKAALVDPSKGVAV